MMRRALIRDCPKARGGGEEGGGHNAAGLELVFIVSPGGHRDEVREEGSGKEMR